MRSMIQKLIHKGLLLLSVLIILFIFLPICLGFDLHASPTSPWSLIYSRSIEFDRLQSDTRLLIKDKDNQVSIEYASFINPVTRTIVLDNQETISENGIVGQAVISIPYLGNVYTTLLAIEYDIKLQVIVLILIIYVLPEIYRSLLKKWRIQSEKVIQ